MMPIMPQDPCTVAVLPLLAAGSGEPVQLMGLEARRANHLQQDHAANRNDLLQRNPTGDGMKTVHTESVGYCLVPSTIRDRMRLVSVVMDSPRARDDASSALLNYGFRFYEIRRLLAGGQPVVTARVGKGDADEANFGVMQNVFVTFPRGQENTLSAVADMPQPLLAPLPMNSNVGKLRVLQNGQPEGTYALHPVADVPQAGLFGRVIDNVKLWLN